MKRKRATEMPREEWAERLRSSVLKFGFDLHLSRAMLEFLCAVADGVRWDRSLKSNLHEPCCFLVTEAALTKRGLIVRKMKPETDVEKIVLLRNFCELTPAGECIVQLAKHAGIFIEASEAAALKMANR